MGIKSFQGRRAEPEKIQSAPILVKDYMCHSLITFKKEDPVIKVIEALMKYKISGAPVVNDQNELIGVISDGECMKQISESRYYNMPIGDRLVEDFMETDVPTIDKNVSIFDCASLFHKHNCRRFPIIEDGKLVGQISRKDILYAAMKLRAQNWHS